jgi:hypothetical protein
MASSFDETLRALQMPKVETLFLHEGYVDNISHSAVAFLRDVKRQGLTQDIGIANSARFDPRIVESLPAEWVLQCAVPPEFFDGVTRSLPGSLVFHTIISIYFWKLDTDAMLNDAVKVSCAHFRTILGENRTAEVVLGYLLLATAAPKAKLIYTTTVPSRLDEFLRIINAV